MKVIVLYITDSERYHISQLKEPSKKSSFVWSPLAPFQKQSHEPIIAFLLSQLDHAPIVKLAKKKKWELLDIKIIGHYILGSMTNLSHTRNFITCPVCAARIRHGVTMVPVGVHFKNLYRIIKKIKKSIEIRQRKNFDNLIKTTRKQVLKLGYLYNPPIFFIHAIDVIVL